MLSKSRLKYIQSLNHKKFRDEEGCFVIEGPKIITEFLLQVPDQIISLYALDNWLNENRQLLQNLHSSVVCAVDDITLGRISSLSTANQVLAVVRQKKYQPEPEGYGEVFLMLDGIQDPGNFGTIIRIADWFGIRNILCSPECADLYNLKVVQASMGSILRVNVEYASLNEWCSNHQDVPIYAATLHGKSLYQFQPITKGAILIGNESKGVHTELLNFCKERITIPRKGEAESLNAAVATGIILSQIIKQD